MKKTLLSLLLLSSAIFASANSEIPRPEYPRPQFERTEWINLNGTWSYEFDFSQSGLERSLFKSKGFDRPITVPFCPESPLSGVNHKDFINAMWYHRKISIPQNWDGKRILLNFGGVDYKSTIYLNGEEIFVHYGGSSSFAIDITAYVKAGSENDLIVYVQDDLRSQLQTAGKQSRRLYSYSCLYTRVTGIWQTVWLEAVSKGGLKLCRITPDLDNKQFVFEPVFYDLDLNATFKVRVLDNGKEVYSQKVPASDNAFISAKIKNIKTWSPESPFLYDIEFSVLDAEGNTIDKVKSYAGMRKVELRGKTFYLNNEPYYQRLVLDQGYYPDGQWTAPDDDQLKKWEECVARDYNATSLVAWSPLNETWKEDIDGQRARLTNDLYFITKRLDRTRPVVSASGGYHAGFTDIYAEHTYVQDPIELYKQLSLDENGYPYIHHPNFSAPYKGEAYMIDEFGGIQWIKEMKTAEVAGTDEFWGYGKPPRTIEEFYKRLEEQVNVVLSMDHITGFCYTQIVDVELEKNGIYTYDRNLKFDMERIRKIFSKSREQAKLEVAKMLSERNAR